MHALYYNTNGMQPFPVSVSPAFAVIVPGTLQMAPCPFGRHPKGFEGCNSGW